MKHHLSFRRGNLYEMLSPPVVISLKIPKSHTTNVTEDDSTHGRKILANSPFLAVWEELSILGDL